MEALPKSRLALRGMKLYDDDDQERAVWKICESGLGDTARIPGEPDTWPGWEARRLRRNGSAPTSASFALYFIGLDTTLRCTDTLARGSCTAAWPSI
jgi:hypothetical protein